MRTVVGIGVAGCLGALARYGLDGFVSRRAGAFPWGTFVVNVSGSFLLGFVVTVLGERVAAAPWLRAALAIGFLGAYTTFSTFAQESRDLFVGGHVSLAVMNASASVVVGLLAVAAGSSVGRLV